MNIRIFTAEITLKRLVDGIEETKILKLSTSAIRGDLMDEQYYARLQGIPNITRRNQNITYGRTAVTYGELSINNPDGFFDQYIPTNLTENWNWEGHNITVKTGFGNEHVNQFKTVFTGIMLSPKITKTNISVSIRDNQKTLFDRNYPKETKTTTIVDVLNKCLKAIGDPQKDETFYNEWVAKNGNKNVYIDTDGSQSIVSILDKVVTPLSTWYGFDRQGNFLIKEFNFAEQTDVPKLTFSHGYEVLEDTLNITPLEQYYWNFIVRYYTSTTDKTQEEKTETKGKVINKSAATNISSGVVGIPVTGHEFSVGRKVQIIGTNYYTGVFTVQQESSSNIIAIDSNYTAETFTDGAYIRDATIEPVIKDSITVDSWLTKDTDAVDSAKKLSEIYGKKSNKISIKVKTQPIDVDTKLGDIVELQDNRFFISPIKCVIVGFTEDYLNATITLELLI